MEGNSPGCGQVKFLTLIPLLENVIVLFLKMGIMRQRITLKPGALAANSALNLASPSPYNQSITLTISLWFPLCVLISRLYVPTHTFAHSSYQFICMCLQSLSIFTPEHFLLYCLLPLYQSPSPPPPLSSTCAPAEGKFRRRGNPQGNKHLTDG